MRIRVGDQIFRASQIEKCIEALFQVTAYPLALQYGPQGYWTATAFDDDYGYVSHGGAPDSPWAALCAMVHENPRRLGPIGITVEPGR